MFDIMTDVWQGPKYTFVKQKIFLWNYYSILEFIKYDVKAGFYQNLLTKTFAK